MRTALSGILAATALLAATPAAADPVPFAPDTTCTGSLGAVTVPGKLVVPAGATCTLTGTRVLGSVEVRASATLRASRINVAGDLLGDQARLISVASGSYVAGHTSLTKGVTVTFSGSTAFGGIDLSENTGRATLTSATVTNGGAQVTKNRGATVHSNRVNENLLVEQNTAGVSVRSNTIGDNLAVHKNTGGTVIAGNRASDNIDCADNVPAPTGSGNVAGADGNGAKTGQCAGL